MFCVMKRLLIISGVALLAVTAACKKAKGPANAKSVQQNNNLDSLVSMSAMINGMFWQTDSAFGSYVQHSDNDSGVVDLMITATRIKNDSISTIVFNISNYDGERIYSINPPENTATFYVGNVRHYARSGQITVTSDTGYSIIGTFSFVADSFRIDNGAFNVALP